MVGIGKGLLAQFDELKLGDPTRYDVESTGSTINVERIDSGHRFRSSPQRASGARSITITVNESGRTGPRPRPPAGGPNCAAATKMCARPDRVPCYASLAVWDHARARRRDGLNGGK
jgi:hypothetical protein